VRQPRRRQSVRQLQLLCRPSLPVMRRTLFQPARKRITSLRSFWAAGPSFVFFDFI
jgi:hypothetical protein